MEFAYDGRPLKAQARAAEGRREGCGRGPGVSPQGSREGPLWAPSVRGRTVAWREVGPLGRGERWGSQGQQHQTMKAW